MSSSRCYPFIRDVNAEYSCSHPGHWFTQEAATTTDIKDL
jgi:hypothetical protein